MQVDGRRRNTVVLVQALAVPSGFSLLSKADDWESNCSPLVTLGRLRKTLHVHVVSAAVIFTSSLLPISAERPRVTFLPAAGCAVSFGQCADLELQGCTNSKLPAAVSSFCLPHSSTGSFWVACLMPPCTCVFGDCPWESLVPYTGWLPWLSSSLVKNDQWLCAYLGWANGLHHTC